MTQARRVVVLDTPTDLAHQAAVEFEVRPVSLLFLGSQGAVDPGPYLASWRPVASIGRETRILATQFGRHSQ